MYGHSLSLRPMLYLKLHDRLIQIWLAGFASWMEYRGVNYLSPEWQMMEQFFLDIVAPALDLDSLTTSHPVSVEVKDPKVIWNKMFQELNMFFIKKLLMAGFEAGSSGVLSYRSAIWVTTTAVSIISLKIIRTLFYLSLYVDFNTLNVIYFRKSKPSLMPSHIRR